MSGTAETGPSGEVAEVEAGWETAPIAVIPPPIDVAALDAEPSATRLDLARDVGVCYSCQTCVGLCDVFPLAFDQIASAGGDAEGCTPAQQDRVADACTLCARCTELCRELDDPLPIDLVATIVRVRAMRFEHEPSVAGRGRRWLGNRLPGRLGRSILRRSCVDAGTRSGSGPCCGAGELAAGNRRGFGRLMRHFAAYTPRPHPCDGRCVWVIERCSADDAIAPR